MAQNDSFAKNLDKRTKELDGRRIEDGQGLSEMQMAQDQLTRILAEQRSNLQQQRQEMIKNMAIGQILSTAVRIGTDNYRTIREKLGFAAGGGGQAAPAQTQQKKETHTVKTVPPNITINNNNYTTTNNTSGGGAGPLDGRGIIIKEAESRESKFKTWLSGVFANQKEEDERREREFDRRESILVKSSNKMLKRIETASKTMSESFNPDRIGQSVGNQFRILLMLFAVKFLAVHWDKVLGGIDSLIGHVKKAAEYFGIGVENTGNKISGFKSDIIKLFGGKPGSGKDGDSIIGSLKNLGKSLIDHMKLKFDHAMELRGEAIKSIKMPGMEGVTGIPEAVSRIAGYLGDILTALVDPKKGIQSSIASNLNSSGNTSRDLARQKGNQIEKLNKYDDNTSMGDAALFHRDKYGNLRYSTFKSDFGDDGKLRNSVSSQIMQGRDITGTLLDARSHGKIDIGRFSSGLSNLEDAAKRHGYVTLDESGLRIWGKSLSSQLINSGDIVPVRYKLVRRAKTKGELLDEDAGGGKAGFSKGMVRTVGLNTLDNMAGTGKTFTRLGNESWKTSGIMSVVGGIGGAFIGHPILGAMAGGWVGDKMGTMPILQGAVSAAENFIGYRNAQKNTIELVPETDERPSVDGKSYTLYRVSSKAIDALAKNLVNADTFDIKKNAETAKKLQGILVNFAGGHQQAVAKWRNGGDKYYDKGTEQFDWDINEGFANYNNFMNLSKEFNEMENRTEWKERSGQMGQAISNFGNSVVSTGQNLWNSAVNRVSNFAGSFGGGSYRRGTASLKGGINITNATKQEQINLVKDIDHFKCQKNGITYPLKDKYKGESIIPGERKCPFDSLCVQGPEYWFGFAKIPGGVGINLAPAWGAVQHTQSTHYTELAHLGRECGFVLVWHGTKEDAMKLGPNNFNIGDYCTQHAHTPRGPRSHGCMWDGKPGGAGRWRSDFVQNTINRPGYGAWVYGNSPGRDGDYAVCIWRHPKLNTPEYLRPADSYGSDNGTVESSGGDISRLEPSEGNYANYGAGGYDYSAQGYEPSANYGYQNSFVAGGGQQYYGGGPTGGPTMSTSYVSAGRGQIAFNAASSDYLTTAKAIIMSHEGFLERPRADGSGGRRSVGYGFNDGGFSNLGYKWRGPGTGISAHYENGITRDQAADELNKYLKNQIPELKKLVGEQEWNHLSESQKAALIDMAYQFGVPGLGKTKFFKYWKENKRFNPNLINKGYDSFGSASEERNNNRRLLISNAPQINLAASAVDMRLINGGGGNVNYSSGAPVSSMPQSNILVGCCGDSWMAGMWSSGGLGNKFKARGINAVGVDGKTFKSGASSNTIRGFVDSAKGLGCNIIVINTGINDGLESGPVISLGQHAAKGGTSVFLCTIPYNLNAKSGSLASKLNNNSNIDNFNNAIRSACNQNGWGCIELNGVNVACNDFHPTGAGYGQLAQVVVNTVASGASGGVSYGGGGYPVSSYSGSSGSGWIQGAIDQAGNAVNGFISDVKGAFAKTDAEAFWENNSGVKALYGNDFKKFKKDYETKGEEFVKNRIISPNGSRSLYLDLQKKKDRKGHHFLDDIYYQANMSEEEFDKRWGKFSSKEKESFKKMVEYDDRLYNNTEVLKKRIIDKLRPAILKSKSGTHYFKDSKSEELMSPEMREIRKMLGVTNKDKITDKDIEKFAVNLINNVYDKGARDLTSSNILSLRGINTAEKSLKQDLVGSALFGGKWNEVNEGEKLALKALQDYINKTYGTPDKHNIANISDFIDLETGELRRDKNGIVDQNIINLYSNVISKREARNAYSAASQKYLNKTSINGNLSNIQKAVLSEEMSGAADLGKDLAELRGKRRKLAEKYNNSVIQAIREGKRSVADITAVFDKQIEDLTAEEDKIKKKLKELSKNSNKAVKELVENIGKTHELMSMNSRQFTDAMNTFFSNAGSYVEGIKAAIQEYGNAVLDRMRSSFGFGQLQASESFMLGGEGKNEGKFTNVQDIDDLLFAKDKNGNLLDYKGSKQIITNIALTNQMRYNWSKKNPNKLKNNPYYAVNSPDEWLNYVNYRASLFRQMGKEKEAGELESWGKRNLGAVKLAFYDIKHGGKDIKSLYEQGREFYSDGEKMYYIVLKSNPFDSSAVNTARENLANYKVNKGKGVVGNDIEGVSKNSDFTGKQFVEMAKNTGMDVGGLVGWTGPGQFNEVAYDVDVHRGELVIPRGDLVKVSSAAGYGSDPFMGAKFVRKLVDRSMQGSSDSSSSSHNVNIESYLELIAMGIGSIVDNTASIQIPATSSSSSNNVEVNQSQLV